ncbi:YybH family protein [Planktosalinus lacus]|nr:nuclear transport factor 2 family protein [Planktosalinus lacus]
MCIVSFFMATLCVSQTIQDEILEVNRTMEKAYNKGELARIAEHYTRDGIIVGNSTEIKGREAITAYWENLQGRHIKWELENVEIIDYGSTVIQRGISRLQFYHENKAFQSDVRFTLVWVKEDNEWKIKIDHYSRI